MLSELQIKTQENYSLKIALNLLVNQMHAIWNEEDYVVSLLLLNIMSVFD